MKNPVSLLVLAGILLLLQACSESARSEAEVAEQALGKTAADELKERLDPGAALVLFSSAYRATLEQGPPAAKMMGPEERAAFFSAGTGLIAPLGQYIRAYEKDLSFRSTP